MEKSDEVIFPVDCRVFHVCARKFICLLARLFKGTVFWWQPSPLTSYHWFWDLITAITLKVPTRHVTRDFRVKGLRTQANMSSRRSVQSHWHFQHYLQSGFYFENTTTRRPRMSRGIRRNHPRTVGASEILTTKWTNSILQHLKRKFSILENYRCIVPNFMSD